MVTSRAVGRPTKLTPTVQTLLLEATRCGSYLAPACAAVSVGYSTVRGWIERGEREAEEGQVTRYSEFAASFRAAEAEAELAAVGAWVSAFRDGGDWRAAAEYLARRHPERWSAKRAEEEAEPPTTVVFDLDQWLEASDGRRR